MMSQTNSPKIIENREVNQIVGEIFNLWTNKDNQTIQVTEVKIKELRIPDSLFDSCKKNKEWKEAT
jgi:hypothetical protein